MNITTEKKKLQILFPGLLLFKDIHRGIIAWLFEDVHCEL